MNVWKIKQSFRRVFSDKSLARNNLIILCNPRSGSTWLLDALRCHPKIKMRKSGGFYNAFGLNGKRYPGDLSQQTDAHFEVEVLPNINSKIPNPKITLNVAHQSITPNFFIEKIHPEFYDFKTNAFIQKIRREQIKGKNFRFIVLMRHPISALKSFYSYQKRNANWYNWADEQQLVNYTLKTFESMAFFQQEMEALMLKYTDYYQNPQKVLKQIYAYLWLDNVYLQSPQCQQDLEQSIMLTHRAKRAQSSSSFLGKQAGKMTVEMEELSFFKEKYRKDLEQMVSIFEQCYVSRQY